MRSKSWERKYYTLLTENGELKDRWLSHFDDLVHFENERGFRSDSTSTQTNRRNPSRGGHYTVGKDEEK